MKTVTAKELKNRTGEVLRKVRAGERVVVTVRGVRVAEFVPVKRAAASEKQQSRRAVIQAIMGKYRGLGSVEEFLREKQRELKLEL